MHVNQEVLIKYMMHVFTWLWMGRLDGTCFRKPLVSSRFSSDEFIYLQRHVDLMHLMEVFGLIYRTRDALALASHIYACLCVVSE